MILVVTIKKIDAQFVPIVVVGNKCDLEMRREVTRSEGERLGALWGCLFMEASALQRINVDEPFLEIVRQIKQMRKKPSPKLTQASLLSACVRGDVSAALALLKIDTSTGARHCGGWTPLHAAAYAGDKTLLDALLRAKANVNAYSTTHGTTPVHLGTLLAA